MATVLSEAICSSCARTTSSCSVVTVVNTGMLCGLTARREVVCGECLSTKNFFYATKDGTIKYNMTNKECSSAILADIEDGRA